MDPLTDTLVGVDWLADHLGEHDLVVLDCRVAMNERGPVSARPEYEAGHISGAAFADLVSELSDTGSPLGFAIPSPEAFCAAIGRLGVGDDSTVVLYDGRIERSGLRFTSVWAARVWWMLRWIGFDRAALLDGGLDAWKDAGHETVSGAASPQPGKLTPRVRPHLVADRDEVRAAVGSAEVTLLDSLPADHFAGRSAMYPRPGHISGAVSVPVSDVLDRTGRFKPDSELRGRHHTDLGRRTITYCGAGIAASASAFALTRIGFTDVAVYAASLQEWAADAANPMSTGE